MEDLLVDYENDRYYPSDEGDVSICDECGAYIYSAQQNYGRMDSLCGDCWIRRTGQYPAEEDSP